MLGTLENFAYPLKKANLSQLSLLVNKYGFLNT
ncbi:hypothetical protein NEOC95_001644 [Neochlamydia sp. AcF95]|nr:hypothetical protein [Neochlamydia sp. AcF95]